MRRALIAAALLALMGCESTPRLDVTPAHRPSPPRVEASPPLVAAQPAPIADTCGATPLQSLIGHPRTEVPVPLHPARQRVMCTTCPMTMDYSPERLNFLFDATTGLIKEIRCG